MLAKLILVDGRASRSEIEFEAPISIGRGDEVWLKIDHRMVSRLHCEIEARDDKLVVRDFSSTNGTFVDGERVEGERILEPGHRLGVGPLTFEVSYDAADIDTVVEELPGAGIAAATSETATDDALLEAGLDEQSLLAEPSGDDELSGSDDEEGDFLSLDDEELAAELPSGLPETEDAAASVVEDEVVDEVDFDLDETVVSRGVIEPPPEAAGDEVDDQLLALDELDGPSDELDEFELPLEPSEQATAPEQELPETTEAADELGFSLDDLAAELDADEAGSAELDAELASEDALQTSDESSEMELSADDELSADLSEQQPQERERQDSAPPADKEAESIAQGDDPLDLLGFDEVEETSAADVEEASFLLIEDDADTDVSLGSLSPDEEAEAFAGEEVSATSPAEAEGASAAELDEDLDADLDDEFLALDLDTNELTDVPGADENASAAATWEDEPVAEAEPRAADDSPQFSDESVAEELALGDDLDLDDDLLSLDEAGEVAALDALLEEPRRTASPDQLGDELIEAASDTDEPSESLQEELLAAEDLAAEAMADAEEALDDLSAADDFDLEDLGLGDETAPAALADDEALVDETPELEAGSSTPQLDDDAALEFFTDAPSTSARAGSDDFDEDLAMDFLSDDEPAASSETVDEESPAAGAGAEEADFVELSDELSFDEPGGNTPVASDDFDEDLAMDFLSDDEPVASGPAAVEDFDTLEAETSDSEFSLDDEQPSAAAAGELDPFELELESGGDEAESLELSGAELSGAELSGADDDDLGLDFDETAVAETPELPVAAPLEPEDRKAQKARLKEEKARAKAEQAAAKAQAKAEKAAAKKSKSAKPAKEKPAKAPGRSWWPFGRKKQAATEEPVAEEAAVDETALFPTADPLDADLLNEADELNFAEPSVAEAGEEPAAEIEFEMDAADAELEIDFEEPPQAKRPEPAGAAEAGSEEDLFDFDVREAAADAELTTTNPAEAVAEFEPLELDAADDVASFDFSEETPAPEQSSTIASEEPAAEEAAPAKRGFRFWPFGGGKSKPKKEKAPKPPKAKKEKKEKPPKGKKGKAAAAETTSVETPPSSEADPFGEEVDFLADDDLVVRDTQESALADDAAFDFLADEDTAAKSKSKSQPKPQPKRGKSDDLDDAAMDFLNDIEDEKTPASSGRDDDLDDFLKDLK